MAITLMSFYFGEVCFLQVIPILPPSILEGSRGINTGIGIPTGGVGVPRDSTGPLGTGAALLTALVWELCGGDTGITRSNSNG